MGCIALATLIGKFAQDLPVRSFLLSNPEYWIFPLQTVACAGLLWHYRRSYPLQGPHAHGAGLVAGLLAIGIWLAPRFLFGIEPRLDGFNPDLFAANPLAYWLTLGFRLVRLVIVVPILEEIFWRGFLMRYLIQPQFTQVAFGTYTHLSFFGTAAGFALVHNTADLIPAFFTGLLWNALAVKTRSLTACIVAHAVTNLLLGLYILHTGEWGYW